MTDFAVPETRYALSGDVNIAYQTMGNGPVDIVVVPGIMSHVDSCMNCPAIPLSCAAFRPLPAWSCSTSGARGCPTG